MTSPGERPDGPGDPEERAWADLVRAFHSTPDATDERSWPAAEDLGPDDVSDDDRNVRYLADDLLSAAEGGDDDEAGDTMSVPRRPADSFAAAAESADRFVPPNPPPIPRGDRISRLAWAGVIVPPIIVLIGGLASISVPTNIMAFLALAFILGFGTLVYRLRGHHPSDPDDGAVL